MRSRSGAEFHVFVSRPLLPPPVDGYPVVYMLDANAAFGTMTEAVRMQSARPEATGVVPAVVVGIGYPTDLPLDLARRTFDYTPEVERAALSARPDGTEWPPTGGAGAFLDFIEDELKPTIAAVALSDGGPDLRLMIAVGALEQTPSPREGETPAGARRAAWIEKNRMVDNAREMAARLARLAPRGLQVAYEEFPGENHVSVIPPLISRALRFALATRD